MFVKINDFKIASLFDTLRQKTNTHELTCPKKTLGAMAG